MGDIRFLQSRKRSILLAEHGVIRSGARVVAISFAVLGIDSQVARITRLFEGLHQFLGASLVPL
jgi:hypothetical protein